MRHKYEKQLPMSAGWASHDLSQELRVISDILDTYPTIYDGAMQDISSGKRTDIGRRGMSGEQVVRCTILMRMHGLSYEKLSFHLADSMSFREFSRLGYDTSVSRSTLQENINKLSMSTWEKINRVLLKHAEANNIEKGRKARGDCTVVETNIHKPHDAGQLNDCIRVVTRTLVKLNHELRAIKLPFHDHRRRAKKRCFAISNTTKARDRKKSYHDLVTVAEKTFGYGLEAMDRLKDMSLQNNRIETLITKLIDTLPLMEQVIDQTKRRVFDGEKVPVDEKVVSIFESHTDIIVKKNRETLFGHKIALMVGKSSMILDCKILKGNPPDSSLPMELVERQKDIWGKVPRQVAFDGGFASKDNLMNIKTTGVKDVSFSKKRGLKISDMVKSSWVYKQLKRFRAGVEGCISRLKRVFNLSRCDWHGDDAFDSYVWSGVATYNLVVLARHLLAQ
jgi:IS5 family transposase